MCIKKEHIICQKIIWKGGRKRVVSFSGQACSTLMSLCMIPFLCKYSKPTNNCFVYALITCPQSNNYHWKQPILTHLKLWDYLQPQEKIQISPKVMILIHQGQIPTVYSRYPPPSPYPSIAWETNNGQSEK